MKTAVDFIVQRLLSYVDSDSTKQIIAKAKELEKEQHEQTFNESRLTHPMIGFKHETFKDYWNETNP
jgi:hypothetical protein